VVLGARGHGAKRDDVLGSVCIRIARQVKTDMLVIKKLRPFEEAERWGIVAAIDGSPESFGGLQAALALGKAYGKPVQAVSAYDPKFHYRVFHSMVEVLSQEAARVFRFKEQEQLHEEIIDTGLARIYQSHLDVARRMAQEEGVELTTTLLTGRPDEQILKHLERESTWLLTVGRTGIHSEDGLEIGSNTENLLRLAPCNVLIAGRRVVPPVDVRAEEVLVWTEESQRMLNRIPEANRALVRTLVHRLALERGDTVVTRELLKEAADAFAPRRDQRHMMGAAAQAVALDMLRQEGGSAYLCQRCAHLSRGGRPDRCPRCKAEGGALVAVDQATLEAIATGLAEGGGASPAPEGNRGESGDGG
jgi:nucleotide-binding universal stress UspA family protein